MHIMCSYTSSYFSIYDDECSHVHYDDDHHHASHDIRGFADFTTSGYEQLAWLWWVLEGANRLETHARTCGSCVGKYYTSNFVLTGGYLYDGFNDRSLIMSCTCLHSLAPIVEVAFWVFLKILESCATSISGKGKTSLYGWWQHRK